MLNEEKLERIAREFILTMSYFMKIGLNQIGRLLDLASFYVHKPENEEDPFELGPYSTIGFFLVCLGVYLILNSGMVFPPAEVAVLFFILLLIGIFLLTR